MFDEPSKNNTYMKTLFKLMFLLLKTIMISSKTDKNHFKLIDF